MGTKELLEELEGNFLGYAINLRREGGCWYIQATAPSGAYAYDGYWRNSESKTVGQALDEAIKGALIYEDARDRQGRYIDGDNEESTW